MGGRGNGVQGPRRLRRQAFAAALALCGTLALTACNADDGDAGAGAGPGGTAPGASAATPSAPSAPAGTAKPSASAAASSKKPSPTATAPVKPKPPTPGPTCATPKDLVSPNEFAVDRYTPEGGSYALIGKRGHWGCVVPGGVTPFVTVGEEIFIPIAEDAKIGAHAPILSGSVNKPITTHELTSWLETHPNKGLVFHYNLNPAGVIDTLGQEEYSS
ncbi:hypothetical protein [Streptomyces sp. NBC_00503]|uniref:hypothetical protein n=1 Tax=Streptomyces sp. NBC_00503 TaxID=2903659 RepID=UPI002E80A857|nr:hypothetical protein [Streptomyces sp. NBC_00503]WUD80738.1 hypothetical protein OG490_09375 [Streptomyces sp. NBC_00503]